MEDSFAVGVPTSGNYAGRECLTYLESARKGIGPAGLQGSKI